MVTTRLAAVLLPLIALLMGFFGLTILAHAEAPTGTSFTYQGQLVRDGAPATGSYDFQFTLYDGAGGQASQVGPTLTRAAVTVTEGRFTVQLDFGAVFMGAPRYLAIAVRPGDSGGAYTPLSPRQALTPVPYAAYAYNAWALGGNTGTDATVHMLGTTDEATLTLAVSDTTALRLAPTHNSTFGSPPNLIGGYNSNTVGNNVVGATIGGGGATGEPNQALADFATVGGGVDNTASGHSATVGGGDTNTASGSLAAVGSGWSNTASGNQATVGGGGSNTASGHRATVGGGDSNTASGHDATVGGGDSNTASGHGATVGGGDSNTASGSYAAVGGGWSNTASGNYATVGGGRSNSAAGSYSFAAGRYVDANHDGSFVWADSTPTSFFSRFASNAANEFAALATGGVRFVTGRNPTTGARLPAGSGSWTSLSDRNAKANVAAVDSDEILAGVLDLPIQSWNYKSQDAAIRHIGPMAQDFAAAFDVGVDDTHISMVDADGVALAAIQGLHELVQEKATRIVTLEEENAELKSESATQQEQIEQLQQQNAELTERLEALEQAVQGLQDEGSQ